MKDGFKSLIVWQKAMILVEEVYKVTEAFPQKERFGLTDQMRRSAISIPSNIAEGNRRGTKRTMCSFLGSLTVQ